MKQSQNQVSRNGILFIAAWAITSLGHRTWMILLPFVLVERFGKSFVLIASKALMQSVATILLLPYFGCLVCKGHRLRVICVILTTMLVTTIAASGAIRLLHSYLGMAILPENSASLRVIWNFLLQHCLFGATFLFFITAVCIYHLSCDLLHIVVLRQWVPDLITEKVAGDEAECDLQRTQMNTYLQLFMLVMDAVGGAAVAALWHMEGGNDTKFTISVFAISSSYVVAAALFVIVYLNLREQFEASDLVSPIRSCSASAISLPCNDEMLCHRFSVLDYMMTLLRHPSVLVVLAASLIHLNVIEPGGGLMTAWMAYIQFPTEWIFLGRSAASFVAMLFTLFYPKISEIMGVITSTLLMGSLDAAMSLGVLLLVIFMTFFSGSGQGITGVLLLLMLVLARGGVRAFDVGCTTVIQRVVEPEKRGLINGQQFVIIELCRCLQHTVALLLPDCGAFYILCIVSVAASWMSSCLVLSFSKGSSVGHNFPAELQDALTRSGTNIYWPDSAAGV